MPILLADAGPIFVGATHRPLMFTWTDDTLVPGSIDLTGASFTARFRNHSSGTAFTGAGVFTPINLSQGSFQYTLAGSDISIPANYEVQITATWVGSGAELSDLFILPVERPI